MSLQPMSAAELRRVTAELGLSLNQLATFLSVTDSRVVRRWANGEFPVSPMATRLLRLIVHMRQDVATVQEWTNAPLD